jgi:hypothetical protein
MDFLIELTTPPFSLLFVVPFGLTLKHYSWTQLSDYTSHSQSFTRLGKQQASLVRCTLLAPTLLAPLRGNDNNNKTQTSQGRNSTRTVRITRTQQQQQQQQQ